MLDINRLHKVQLTRLTKFLGNNIDVFTKHILDIGCITDYLANVTLIEVVKNFSVKHLPIPRHLNPGLARILDRYNASGIIPECNVKRMYSNHCYIIAFL